MKKTLLALAVLTGLAACSDGKNCVWTGEGDDVYRKRTRDYNWYDGRKDYHGETGQRDAIYHNGAKDGQWTKAQ